MADAPADTLLQTERLILRRFRVEDAAFVLEMFNEPSFIRFIGDRGVRELEGARGYIEDRFLHYYSSGGIGPFLVESKATSVAMGFCSLFRRDWLEDVDLGFAFLPAYWSQGYAGEAAMALMRYASQTLGLRHLVAITTHDNEVSARLLDRLGFSAAGPVRPPGAAANVRLFAVDL